MHATKRNESQYIHQYSDYIFLKIGRLKLRTGTAFALYLITKSALRGHEIRTKLNVLSRPAYKNFIIVMLYIEIYHL